MLCEHIRQIDAEGREIDSVVMKGMWFEYKTMGNVYEHVFVKWRINWEQNWC